jgi:hypothetical protein
MNRWFRVYDDVLDDPKVQRLSAENFRGMVNVWCLASKNDGRIPPPDEVAFKLRMSPKKATKLITDLETAGLVDADADGLTPHNWNARQFKSDSSTERVKRFRQQQRNVACNVSPSVTETAPESETESETEKNDSSLRSESAPAAPASKPKLSGKEIDQKFEEFWSAYPRRDGGNPRKPAHEKFTARVRSGVDPDAMILGAKRYASECERLKKVGTEFVKQAQFWLSQDRWDDYGDQPESKSGMPAKSFNFFAAVDSEQWKAWDRYLKGRGLTGAGAIECRPDQNGSRQRGWYFQTVWPPDHQPQAPTA